MVRPKAPPAKEPTQTLMVRLPKSIHLALKEKAVNDVRSLNGQIVWALRDWLEAAEKKAGGKKSNG